MNQGKIQDSEIGIEIEIDNLELSSLWQKMEWEMDELASLSS